LNTIVPGSNSSATSTYGTGGAWETPLVGSDGSVTFGIGNPYQTAAAAIAHPSAQLYADSEVNLDAATGKLRWYYQGVTNDFMDHDMQTSPIAASINGEPAVIGSGKMGVVYAMDASTGRLIWKTPVGGHSISDDYSLEAMEHKLTLKAPYTILPGSLGGLLSNPALAGNNVYVATVDLPFTLPKMSYPLGVPDGTGTGEIEALNLTTGKVEWDTKVPAMPLGATTVSNDLVFTPCTPVCWSPSTATPAPSSTSTSCRRPPTPPSPSLATRSSSQRAVPTSTGQRAARHNWWPTQCREPLTSPDDRPSGSLRHVAEGKVKNCDLRARHVCLRCDFPGARALRHRRTRLRRRGCARPAIDHGRMWISEGRVLLPM